MKEQYIKITKKFYNESLNFLPFNRKYGVRKDLVEKLSKEGWICDAILISTDLFGKKQIFVADGQNRIVTAMYLGITPIGKLVDRKFKDQADLVQYVADLNTTQKTWQTIDYANVYAWLNIQDYIDLLKITHSSPYSINVISAMLYGFRSQRGNAPTKIRQGKFKIYQREHTLQTLKYAAKLSKHVYVDTRMVQSLHYISSLKGFNFDEFEKQYIIHAKYAKSLKLDDYTDLFSSWLL